MLHATYNFSFLVRFQFALGGHHYQSSIRAVVDFMIIVIFAAAAATGRCGGRAVPGAWSSHTLEMQDPHLTVRRDLEGLQNVCM